MRKYLFIWILVLSSIQATFAQNNVLQVTGIVKDEANEPLIGVNIIIKDNPGLGAITDMNGRFKIKAKGYDVLCFSYIGYDKQEIPIKDRQVINIKMEPSQSSVLDEVTVTGTGIQKKATVTGAITTVDVNTLRHSGGSNISINNTLAGNVPGIIAIQYSGEPGQDTSEFWIRGISTFGASQKALILVDGFEREMSELNIEDIESFSVLKDASATAIYGSKGANGVVLITTRQGHSGKVKIEAKVETTYNTRTRTPEYVDAYSYAQMMNEALITRNREPKYTPKELEIIRMGLDQDLYPNVDWQDVLLKDGAWTETAKLNISGGGTTARYYLSGSFMNNEGMYKTDDTLKNQYNTNSSLKRWNYRMNVDFDVTKTTMVTVGVSGWLSTQNDPGLGSDALWKSVMGQTPINMPVIFSNGRIPAAGTSERTNPWVIATQTGYYEEWQNVIQTNATLDQKLDFITKGLKFTGRFGFDTYNNNYRNHKQWPEQWQAERQRDSNGEIVFKKVAEKQLMFHESSASGNRRQFLEAILQYDRRFGDHSVGGTLKYTQDEYVNTQSTAGYDWLPNRHMGLAGRITYGWKYRYMVDFNFGYNGSENFAPGNQFGFFPAYSVAWNIAEEPIIKKNLKWMNMFKLRYSYGKVGSDNIGTRFPYLELFESRNPYNWGDYNTPNVDNGQIYKQISSSGVTWEIATKHDIGVDFSLWDDRFTGTVDYFHETRDGIFMQRQSLPGTLGLSYLTPSANVGKVRSTGFDGNVAFKQDIGNVSLTVRGNFTYSNNKILAADEANSAYPYIRDTGYRVNQAKGLIALGLFKDYDDIRNSPQQTEWGTVMPGDIKYKDVNSDGVINDSDRVPIGSTTRPNLIYGFGMSATWKGFDVNLHFQGAGKSSFFIDGFGVRPFSGGDWGNILTDVVGNYWSLGTNENPDAKYPRLTWQNNSNNNRESTYWLRDGSYLRLKTVEVGYTLPKNISRAILMNNVRIFFIGTNLLTFSKFKLWDPEMGSSNGQQYPLSKMLTLGLTVNI
jgi:TonB-linked SusC/RagA family outer membrane protein